MPNDKTQYPHVQTITQWAGGRPWQLELQHSCAQHALIWQTRGQTRAIIEGQRRGIGAHNMLALPAGTMFSIELPRQSFGQVCLIPAGGRLLMPDEPTLISIQDVRHQAELSGLLEALQREQSMERPFADEAVFAFGELLTVWLRRAIIQHGKPEAKPSAALRLVRAFAALVERDHTKGQPMSDYAKALGVTPTHLTRVCRQTAGMTAADMLLQRSLHAARSALELGDRPITHIAAELGFNSAAYFSRFVQHHTGASPSALRKFAQSQPRPAMPMN
ncbi:helix-turn-helix transcriptional regulator [Roseovarius faecimaris]|uniref:helix-turn-helix transcriptional regulator n=1 Tax=Roseovarius faecimaris TaxID=2494550 RepID=UPI001FE43BAF|nr:helix-turn-helix domain-containing protein [Roseovarius faecimaris]